jgi:phosphomannomutase
VNIDDNQDYLELTPEVILDEQLEEWAADFKLGTAGYRDQLDPKDKDNPKVAFNRIKVAVIAEAKARVSERRGGGKIDRHVGGEVRPHTREFIELAARIYAAHGHRVHLRAGMETTPIWYSSFGVFFEELSDGENFTASHSPGFKGGWKPMDSLGKQLLGEAELIGEEVRKVVSPGVRIPLAPPDSPLILRDFDVTEAYCDYVRSIIPEIALEEIRTALRRGFQVHISTLGGSMARTAGLLFERLGISEGLQFLHAEEDSAYHNLGIVEGVHHGVDPGKWQIYKGVGAQRILSKAGPGAVFFIWDPDGDRFNMVTTAPSSLKEKAVAYGLEVDELDSERVLVYFKPNQIYFMLTLLRIAQLTETGDLDRFDWIVAETFPTSRSIGEVAERHGLRVVRTPVGFKYFGEITQQIEAQLEEGKTEVVVLTPTGERVPVGRNPRILLMAEESGGAAMGGSRFAVSKNGQRKSLAMKEKDGFQVGLAVMALAARLFLEEKSFARFYVDEIDRNQITYRHYERMDVTLYDESLPPEALAAAKEEGLARRDRVVAFFRSLVDRPLEEVSILLKEKNPQVSLPPVKKILWAGDGTLIDFEEMWWEVRASGTDAVLRYYIEGRERDVIRAVNRSMGRMNL